MTKQDILGFIHEIGLKKICRSVWNAFSPIVYLAVWFLFVKFSFDNFFYLNFNPDLFLFLSFLVLVFGLITKSTSWSIGHTSFGIKGDSRARIINYHKNESGDFWFDLFADNPELLEKEEIVSLIEKLTSNQQNT